MAYNKKRIEARLSNEEKRRIAEEKKFVYSVAKKIQ